MVAASTIIILSLVINRSDSNTLWVDLGHSNLSAFVLQSILFSLATFMIILNHSVEFTDNVFTLAIVQVGGTLASRIVDANQTVFVRPVQFRLRI